MPSDVSHPSKSPSLCCFGCPALHRHPETLVPNPCQSQAQRKLLRNIVLLSHYPFPHIRVGGRAYKAPSSNSSEEAESLDLILPQHPQQKWLFCILASLPCQPLRPYYRQRKQLTYCFFKRSLPNAPSPLLTWESVISYPGACSPLWFFLSHTWWFIFCLNFIEV